jgi:hypothetical protein
MAESEVRRLLLSLEHAREKPNAFLDLLKSVPCILHLESRVAIKILTVLLIHGLSLSDHGKLKAPAFANTSKLWMQHFVGAVEEVTNTKLLGSHVNPTQWVFPIDTSDKDQPMKVGTIYLSNTRSRKIMNGLERLIRLSIPNRSDQEKWIKAIKYYRRAIIILRKKGEDYTEEELTEYQDCIDIFYQFWVTHQGVNGMSNYIHDLGSGHVLEYMREWGNLNKYSQQGWENLNKMVKALFFKCTNHGGGGRKGKTSKIRKGMCNKLLPIVKIFQRRAYWISGEADKLFCDSEEEPTQGNEQDEDGNLDFAYENETWA